MRLLCTARDIFLPFFCLSGAAAPRPDKLPPVSLTRERTGSNLKYSNVPAACFRPQSVRQEHGAAVRESSDARGREEQEW